MANSDEMNLTEIKRRVIDAAAGLIEQKGRGATVEAIAAAAGVSVPVTYQFIKKPTEIMLLIMDNLQKSFSQGIEGRLSEDPVKALAEAVTRYYQVVDRERSKVMLVYRNSRDLDQQGRAKIMALEMETKAIFQSIIEDGVNAGVFQAPAPDLAAYDIIMMGHMWSLKQWYFRELGIDLEHFIGVQINLLMRMLQA